MEGTSHRDILLVILPCYNPDSGWHRFVVKNINLIQYRFDRIEVRCVIVNDGSQMDLENDLEYVKRHIDHLDVYEFSENHGKGYSIRKAVREESADYYLFTDIDIPYTIDSMANLIDELITNKLDFALGVRNEQYYKNISFARRKISGFLRNLNRLCFRLITNDTQCGLKGFNKMKGKEMFLKTTQNRYLFDLELIRMISRRNDLRISLCPVSLREDVRLSGVKVSSLIRELKNYVQLIFR